MLTKYTARHGRTCNETRVNYNVPKTYEFISTSCTAGTASPCRLQPLPPVAIVENPK